MVTIKRIRSFTFVCAALIVVLRLAAVPTLAKTSSEKAALLSGAAEPPRVGLVGCDFDHRGSTAKGLGVPFGLIGMGIAAAADNSAHSGGKDYKDHLGDECLAVIEEAVSSSNRLRLVRAEDSFPGGIPRGNAALKPSAETLNQLRSTTKPELLVSMDMKFTVFAGFKKKLGIKTIWTIRDADGVERAKIKTVVAADSATQVFPNTKDPRHEALFTELARRSAFDFVAMLEGEEPQYERHAAKTPKSEADQVEDEPSK